MQKYLEVEIIHLFFPTFIHFVATFIVIRILL